MPFVAANSYPWPYDGDPGNHAAALQMVTNQNGVFGAVWSSSALLEAHA